MADEFEPVVLLDPDGQEYTATSPREVNDLMYGHGYRPKGKGKTIEEISAAAGGLPVGTGKAADKGKSD